MAQHSVVRVDPAAPRLPGWQRLARITLIVIAVLVVACVAVAAYFDWRLTHPQRTSPTFTPAGAGLAYSDVSFPSRQGNITLSGWFMPAGQSDRTVIIADGYATHRLGETAALPIARILVRHGYNVLTFDFRAAGRSGGNLVTVGEYEQYDVLGAVAYVQQRFAGRHPRIGLLGFSMGAMAGLEAAAQNSAIAAVISDSAIADLYTYLQGHAQQWSHLPSFPFNALILWEAPIVTGLDAHKVHPLTAVRTLRYTPVLFIAGLADKTVPYENTVQLYHAADPRDALWLVPGADHTKAYDVEPAAYSARMLAFFGRTLR